MNFGIGFSLFSDFLQSQEYYRVCATAYAVLLIAPFIFWISNRRTWLMLIDIYVAFISVRLLSLYTSMQNPDEGQHLLMAYSVINGGVPFRDFEGNGLGPLNAFYLALFSFGNISFFTGRLATLCAYVASTAMIFVAVKKLCGRRPAIALTSPMLFYYSIYYYDITAYNCETLFTLLLALWFLLFVFRGENRMMLFAECFVIGLLPWIKLQFAPFSLSCLALSLTRCFFVHSNNYNRSSFNQLLLSKDSFTAYIAAALPT